MPSSDNRAGDPASLARRIAEPVRSAAVRMFAKRFGRAPTRAAFAPGRVNLIGEHTDYSRGFVLPIAIERETVIVADVATRPASTLVSADLKLEMTVNLGSAVQSRKGEPANHLLGVVDQFQKRGLTPPNMDVLLTSSVPMGAGLGSSAAMEVAFATLLADLLHAPLSPLETARLCQAAEHAFPGTPCGIMDMYASAAARERHALLIDCRSDEARHLPADFAALGASLLVIDSGVQHELASSAYANRRATCEAAAALLGLSSLREATIESLNTHGLSDDQRRKALHVIAENTRTILAAEALALGDLPRFGELMFQSHASLRDLYEVSCAELDAVVDDAKAMRDGGEGVLGARMTGGGFGGCAIVLCETASLDRTMDHLRSAFARRFNRTPGLMFATSAAGGARTIELRHKTARGRD